MRLSKFNILVAIDSRDGISRNGKMPWYFREDLSFFREKTIGKGNNALIMGRKTYESIPKELDNRTLYIISHKGERDGEGKEEREGGREGEGKEEREGEGKEEREGEGKGERDGVFFLSSILSALQETYGKYDNVYVIGGESIYKQIVEDYLYLCKKIYITIIDRDYECDQFFPYSKIKYPGTIIYSCGEYKRHLIKPKVKHSEKQYLKALENILNKGENKNDRTQVGTLSLFGSTLMEFDIRERLPVITTKKVNYENITRELLFFISGKTDTKILEKQGVNIWKENTSLSFLNGRGLSYEEGEAGPIYGYQWRHWGRDYPHGREGDGRDQLSHIIEEIKKNPESRRLILSSWNVSQLDRMALPPCHILAQFNVSGDGKYLDCELYQRSGDFFLGIPYNITSYCLLTYMIAHITGLQPRKFSHVVGDAHIYKNHILQVRELIERGPLPFPKLSLNPEVKNIDDFTFEDISITGYQSHGFLYGKMAV